MKIALLKTDIPSNWQSVQTIANNIEKTYRALPGAAIDVIPLSFFNNDLDWEKTFENIFSKNYDRVVIDFNHPCPMHVLRRLLLLDENLYQNTEVVLHVFGCIRFWLHEMIPLKELIGRMKIKFVTASAAQARFLKKVLQTSDGIYECPFSIDVDVFSAPSNPLAVRTEFRQKYGIPSDALVFIYTGRAHLQKNFHLMLEELIQTYGHRMHFIFAGSYDDDQIAALRIGFDQGLSYHLTQNILRTHDFKNFIFIHNRPHREVVEALQASDIFCSWSTYNDEDYGYSPLEALSCGTPALITNWGGYNEFTSEFTRTVPVVLRNDGVFLDTARLQEKVTELLLLGNRKHDMADFYRGKFSVKTLSKKLNEILQATTYLKNFSTESVRSFDAFFDHKTQFSNYLETYKTYLPTDNADAMAGSSLVTASNAT
jgi:glycosyltransferase involved in cell wall biosynthesis